MYAMEDLLKKSDERIYEEAIKNLSMIEKQVEVMANSPGFGVRAKIT